LRALLKPNSTPPVSKGTRSNPARSEGHMPLSSCRRHAIPAGPNPPRIWSPLGNEKAPSRAVSPDYDAWQLQWFSMVLPSYLKADSSRPIFRSARAYPSSRPYNAELRPPLARRTLWLQGV